MKKKYGFTRIVTLVLVMVMLLTYLTSCKQNEPEVQESYLDMSQYTIIRPTQVSKEIIEAVASLRSNIEKNYGSKIELKDDFLKFGEAASNDTYEILIGETNREASVNTLSELQNYRVNNKNDYCISVVGNKIVILGVDDRTTLEAINYFSSTILPNLANGTLADTFKWYFRQEYNMVTINGNSIGDYSIRLDEAANARPEVLLAATALQARLRDLSGFELPIVTDGVVEAYAIDIKLNGTTVGEANVRLNGNNLEIVGGHYYSLTTGIDELMSYVANNVTIDSSVVLGAEYDGAVPLVSSRYEDMELVWHDEFNDDSVQYDVTHWSLESMPLAENKRDLISDDVLYTEEGDIVFRGYIDDSDTELAEERPYCNARNLSTRHTMSYQYGYLEMRAKIPFKSGFWPAFYTMMEENPDVYPWYSEIDIFEGMGATNGFWPNIHKWNAERSNINLDSINYRAKYNFKGVDPSLDYHTYGYYWDEEKMIFSVDGLDYFTVDISENGAIAKKDNSKGTLTGNVGFHAPVYLMVGMGIIAPNMTSAGDTNAGNADRVFKAEQESEAMRVDYIRLYQGDNGILILGDGECTCHQNGEGQWYNKEDNLNITKK